MFVESAPGIGKDPKDPSIMFVESAPGIGKDPNYRLRVKVLCS